MFDRFSDLLGEPDWTRLDEAVRAAAGELNDPAVAAGLIEHIGPDRYCRYFRAWLRKVNSDGYGPSADRVARDGNRLAPLATAFAAADAGGVLPAELRNQFLDRAANDELATLIALAPQSPAFLAAAAGRILRRAGDKVFGRDWNAHWLVTALGREPRAMRLLLASADDAALLFDPKVVNRVDTPRFKQVLADAVDNALGTGDAEAAWVGLITVLADKKTRKSLQRPIPPLKPPDRSLNEVLAKNIRGCLASLAAVQAAAEDRDLSPGPPWDALSPAVAVHFLGAVMQDPKALTPLRDAHRDLLAGLTLGRVHPLDTERARAELFTQTARTGAATALLIGGLYEANLTAETETKALADTLYFPVDVAINMLGIPDAVDESMLGEAVGEAKRPLERLISKVANRYGLNPADAGRESPGLADAQLAMIEEAMRANGLEPLSRTDRGLLRRMFRGMLAEVMVEALRRRGG